MKNDAKIKELKAQLEVLYSEMCESFEQQKRRNQAAFLLTREIEQLENPGAYEENKAHWEGHEIRF